MLCKRATEPEHFDDPARTPEEVADAYRQLERVNRLFFMHDPYTRVMAKWLGHQNCQRLSILDVGAGDGWLGNAMEKWARKHCGWDWHVTHLETNRVALKLNRSPRNVIGSALALPFVANSFDVVIASQMTHHLESDEDVIRHFREAYRVARRGVFITDMQRTRFLYTLLWLTLRLLRLRPEMRKDGLLSVRRSFRRHELEGLAAQAGLTGATVHSYHGVRVIVAAKKIATTAAASETSAAYHAADEFCSVPSGR
jgi:ubiquinone/menaquinone biosynthesis C-methylase UbiE